MGKEAGATEYIKEALTEQVRQLGREGKNQAWPGEEYLFEMKRHHLGFLEDSFKGLCGLR